MGKLDSSHILISIVDRFFKRDREKIESHLRHKHLLLCNAVLVYMRKVTEGSTLTEAVNNMDSRLADMATGLTQKEPTEVYDTTAVDTYFAFKLLCQI